jgi:thioredoxin-dependent peroxiredoxin
MAKLTAGDVAPAIELPDEHGKTVSLASYAGRRVVVYFYPRDDTPGCTKEACQFTDLFSSFSGLGVEVLGISADDAASHQKFRAKYGLQITLLTDADHAVMEAYGAWGEKTNYGKKFMGVIRSTFLVGPDGRIERAWYNVRADGHAQHVLDALAA